MLRVDAGRRCSTGDGHFFFSCLPSNGQPVDAIVSQIHQLALEAKQRLRQEQATRQQILQQHHSLTRERGSSGLLPPPVPSKSSSDVKCSSKLENRISNPKNSFSNTINSSANSDSGVWRNSGIFKRASSTPARRQEDVTSDSVATQKEEELTRKNDSLSSNKNSEILPQKTTRDENNGVFLALPGRAVSSQLNCWACQFE